MTSSGKQLSIGANDAVATTALEYEVLYFARSKKVHKSKGVSKFDGVLSINVTTGSIRLKDSTADDEDESDEDDADDDDNPKGRKKKSFSKKKKQRANKAIPFSGNDKALAQRAQDSLQDDDTIVLGGYEVQIVSRMSAASQPTKKPATLSFSSRKRPAGLNSGKTGSVSILSNKRAFVAKPLKSVSKPSLQSRQQQPLAKRKPLLPLSQSTSLHPRRAVNPSRATTQVAKKPAANNGNACQICPGIPLTGQIRNVLLPHQVVGVEFLWNALVVGPDKGAILADEMGLGKTLMTIATIVGLHRTHREKHFIVVCPSSLVSNWAKEFDKWVGKASQPKRVVIQSGKDESISRLKAIYSSTKSIGGQVLILSFDIFRRVTQNIKQNIGLVVIDEAHKMKNKDAQTFTALASIPTEARLCITATPVQNNLKEFYTLANFVRPSCLGEINEFRREYERPIAAANHKNASTEQKARGKEQSKALDALIKPFMLRRLRKDIRNDLPPRETLLLFCRPTHTQTSMYQELCRKATWGVSDGRSDALATLQTLQKLCTHPAMLEKNKAAVNLLSNESVALSGKLAVLETLLMAIREQRDKVVIVSNFTTVLSLLEATILRPKQMPFVRLDGSTDQSDRQVLVDNFNRKGGSGFAFLLSSKSGGCGLNLIGVILQRQMTKEALEVMNGSSKKSTEKFSKEEIADCFSLKACDCDTKDKLGLGSSWPNYVGPDSLEAQGSKDQVLQNVAGTMSDVLSFVHLCVEKQAEVDASDEKSNHEESNDGEVEPEDEEAEESSSDEEMEF
ncbi:DNA repair and recombination protein RAD54-like (Fragment) [Seminavis robusta]|uniref:DNA repair and recombination protein RAD54-like n=1 Tax=Seminavis robusta TaxID=568900 RepID=A0A9N8HBC4_9STRA